MNEQKKLPYPSVVFVLKHIELHAKILKLLCNTTGSVLLFHFVS
jgi:hypothetical protein